LKITAVRCHLLTADLTENALTALTSSIRYWTTVLAEIETDEGISGLGECYAGLFAPEATKSLIETFAPLLVGEDPLEVESLFEKMCSKSLFWAKAGLPLAVVGVLENALWDIRGKAMGKPVWELLGGENPEPIKVYASGGLEADEQILISELEQYLDVGFAAVKIRIWGSLEEDVAKMRLARRILGDETELMVDGVMGHNPDPWTAEQALERAKAMEELNVVWFEEPCGNRDYAGYASVRENSTVAVAGGESAVGLHELQSFFEAGSLDFAQPDATHSGGIIECRKIAELAKSYGVQTVYHSWGAAPCLLANYHLAFSQPGTPYLEFPTHGLPFIQELAINPFELEDGRFRPSTSPGLGVHLPDGLLERFRFKEGTGFWT
jgi:L-alanine-DL-glutamate epimerase-like enolase superfamily enzyme